MKVLKFGGTSVGTADRIKSVASLMKEEESVLVVLSAMSGTTDKLVEIGALLFKNDPLSAKEIISSLEQKYLHVVDNLFSKPDTKNKGNQLIDNLFNHIKSLSDKTFSESVEKEMLAQGELISTHLFHYYLEEIQANSWMLPALDFMQINEDNEPDIPYIENTLQKLLAQNKNHNIYITQGYICRNARKETDNLKRGGSDYTATLIGSAIRAEEVQIWTDIDGVHNNDPRYVENTKPVTHLSFDEAAELAYFGAKILHPTSVLPCIRTNTPVRLKNTLNPAAPGTIISSNAVGEGIKAIAAKDDITAIKVKSDRMLLAYGFLRKVFEVFEKYKIPIDMITTSEVSVSLTIDNSKYLNEICEELGNFGSVEIDRNQSIICIVGDLIAEKRKEAVEIFQALEEVPVRMISYGGSRHNISILVPSEYKKQALVELSRQVF